ncbi:DUF2207 domain-containing protein [Clostridium malenominatum]|uniref:DUF2207 domain-containing protein n=1 Tax=Clostridium malenominatum TaxID=1539 RepID=A0ABN1IT34_9CLOT
MKKYIKIITLLLIFTFIFTGKVEAKDNIEITNWNVKADVLDEGSIVISEYITFKFSGSYNGVFREIKTQDTDGIENLIVSEQGSISNFKEVKKGKNGDEGIYEVDKSKDGVNIKIYSPSKNTEKTFILSYKVKNVCKKYNDAGELYYSFLGKENKTLIHSFNVNINFPYNFHKDEVSIFAHGPLNGEIKFVNNSTINLNVKNVSEGNLVAGRIVFPKEYIKNSTNIVNKNGYNDIVEEEKGYARKIEENKVKKEKNKIFGKYISQFLSLLAFFIFVISKLKYRREKFSEDYISYGLPEECTPAVLGYFYNFAVNSNTILATILDLNRKGYLNLEEIGGEENSKGRKKSKTKIYKISRIRQDAELLEHERFFMNWIIDEVGDGYYATTEGIKKYSEKHVSEFINKNTEWTKLIKEEVNNRGYYDLSARKYSIKLMIISAVMFALSIPLIVISGGYGVLSFALFLVLFLWSAIGLYNKKTPRGERQYEKWKRFKESIEKERKSELFSDYPMDKYFIYSLVLGIDDRKINGYKDYIENNSNYNNGYYNTNSFLWFYFYAGMFNNKTGKNEFSSSIGSAFSSSTPSTGSGGGFSGGGGFGGGAGGGGAGGF